LAKHSHRGLHQVGQSPTIVIVGAESLLGKDLRELLDSSGVPANVKLVSAEEELGIITESAGEPAIIGGLAMADVASGKAVLLAGSPQSSALAFERVQKSDNRPVIVDLTGAVEDQPDARLRAPMVESAGGAAARSLAAAGRIQVIAHPAAIALALFLKRVQARAAIRRSVVHVFEPASERGQPGLDELQQQTVGLLSFQKLKQEIYDAQVSFNMLPQFGSEAPKSLAEIELKIERHLASLLAFDSNPPPMPSLRLIQAPVFHGYSISIWIEFEQNPSVEALSKTLASEAVEVRSADGESPTNVGAVGQSGIAVGSIVVDRNHPRACWFWIVADNLRIAAENAVGVVIDLLA
jgi:aspartate-semialdehyde dehydrogenase